MTIGGSKRDSLQQNETAAEETVPLIEQPTSSFVMRMVIYAEGMLALFFVIVVIAFILYATHHPQPELPLPSGWQPLPSNQKSALATVINPRPAATPATGAPRSGAPGIVHSLNEAQRYVPFRLLQPEYTPPAMKLGMIKVEATDQPRKTAVTMTYSEDSSLFQLLLIQSNMPLQEPADQREVEPFRVSGQEGRLVIDSAGTPHAYWERDGIYFSFEPLGTDYEPVGDNSLLDVMRQMIESLPDDH